MQAFGEGNSGNHNLPFRIMSWGRIWSHQNPYCCYICSKPEAPEPELQRVVDDPIKRVAGHGELLPNCESQFSRAFASQRCPAVYSPVADGDSPRAPAGCRFKRCKEIIKVEEPSAKIGLAYFLLSAPSAYAKK